ncbi:unnamed protein product [Durusdinium trenchii]|uniref:Uncharacterized protein n=1 Tax=Durusdinium trenchii TaxID=1381693 RepID=A0ABP0P1I7_9DINO
MVSTTSDSKVQPGVAGLTRFFGTRFYGVDSIQVDGLGALMALDAAPLRLHCEVLFEHCHQEQTGGGGYQGGGAKPFHWKAPREDRQQAGLGGHVFRESCRQCGAEHPPAAAERRRYHGHGEDAVPPGKLLRGLGLSGEDRPAEDAHLALG